VARGGAEGEEVRLRPGWCKGNKNKLLLPLIQLKCLVHTFLRLSQGVKLITLQWWQFYIEHQYFDSSMCTNVQSISVVSPFSAQRHPCFIFLAIFHSSVLSAKGVAAVGADVNTVGEGVAAVGADTMS